jgi:hypothetical protein
MTCINGLNKKNATRYRMAFGYINRDKRLEQRYSLILFIFLFDQKQPRPGNSSCGVGLALSFSLHEDACVVSKHIGRYSTRCEKYVNDFKGDLFKLVS